MRKLLIAALVIAIAVAAVVLYKQSQTPERQILGKWTGSYEIGSFNFKDDGTVTISFSNLSSEGSYDLNSETSVLSISYKLLGISYTKHYIFALNENMLTLTDETFSNIKLVYYKAAK